MAFTGVCHETTKRASIVASVISVAMLSLRNITIAFVVFFLGFYGMPFLFSPDCLSVCRFLCTWFSHGFCLSVCMSALGSPMSCIPWMS